MRIAITSDTYYPMTNGVAVFTTNLARGLAKQGHEVMVFVPSATGNYYSRKDFGGKLEEVHLSSKRFPFYPDQIHTIPKAKKVLGIKIPRVAYKNGLWMAVKPYSEMKKELDAFQPEIIHSQTAGTVGLAAAHYAKKYDVPFVSTGHSYPDNYTSQFKLLKPVKKPVDAVVKAYLTSYMKNGEFATMPTEMAINDLVPKNRKRFKVEVEALSNGIDLSQFKPKKPATKTCEKYNLDSKKTRIAYIGRVDPEKSIDVIIDAFSLIAEEFPDTELIIVGDGVAKIKLQKQVAELGLSHQIRFLGKILPPELIDVYRSASFFATASETETQGIVLIEAAAIGLPLIAVDAGAVKELCQNKKNGFLCRPKDVKQISRAMKTLLSDEKLRKEYGNNSLEMAKKHDLGHTLSRFLEIYQEAIKSETEKDD